MKGKGRFRKNKMILIRVNEEEKKAAEDMAKEARKNTSEFFRSLLQEHRDSAYLDVHMRIAEKYQSMLEQYRQLLEQHTKKK